MAFMGDLGHGHSHGNGGTCKGHGHSHGDSGGDSHGGMELTDEMRLQMLKHLQARMAMHQQQQQQQGGDGGPMMMMNFPGHVFHTAGAEKPNYSSILHGYGHDPTPPPMGWGHLAPAPPPVPPVPSPDEMMKLDMEEIMNMMMPPVKDHYWLVRVPFLGRARIVRDVPGWIQAAFIVLYWIYGNWSTWNAILLPRFDDGTMPFPAILCTL